MHLFSNCNNQHQPAIKRRGRFGAIVVSTHQYIGIRSSFGGVHIPVRFNTIPLLIMAQIVLNDYLEIDTDSIYCIFCNGAINQLDSRKLSENIASDTSTLTVLEVLQSFSDFKAHMGGPEDICTSCYNNVQFVYDFQQVCNKAYKNIQHNLEPDLGSNDEAPSFETENGVADAVKEELECSEGVEEPQPKKKFKEFRKIHFPKRIFTCRDCKMGFYSSKLYQMHLAKHEVAIPKERIMNYEIIQVKVDQGGTNETIFRIQPVVEEEEVEPEIQESLICHYCGLSFINRRLLNRHFLKHAHEACEENDSEKLGSISKLVDLSEHVCDICGIFKYKKDHLRRHIRTHTADGRQSNESD